MGRCHVYTQMRISNKVPGLIRRIWTLKKIRVYHCQRSGDLLYRLLLLLSLLLLLKEVDSARLGESDQHPYQSEYPSITIPTYRPKAEKGTNRRRQKRIEHLFPRKKNISPTLETSHSHTIEYRVGNIVPQGH